MIETNDNGYQMTLKIAESESDNYNEMVTRAFNNEQPDVTYAWDVVGGVVTVNIVIPGMETVDSDTVESELLDILNE